MYELTFKGETGDAIASVFEGFDVHSGSGVTTVRARLPDQAALHGLLDRAGGLGLEVLSLRQVVDIQPSHVPADEPWAV